MNEQRLLSDLARVRARQSLMEEEASYKARYGEERGQKLFAMYFTPFISALEKDEKK